MSSNIKFNYKIFQKSKKSQARLGRIETKNGVLETPAFVVVATNAAVKAGLDPADLQAIGAQVVLGNTYHLFVRDQVKAIEQAGGLGKFMGWPGPTFTDSGGFQVFSLGQRLEDGVGKFANYDLISPLYKGGQRGVKGNDLPPAPSLVRRERKPLVKISERGVEFKSHLDGKRMKMTPESSIKIQEQIGADMIFAFDEPTSPTTSLAKTREAMERTHRWAKRCLKAHKQQDQALFGIVQGGPYQELRQESAKFMADLDFPGFGIGGSYHRRKGDSKFAELDWVIPHLPAEKPRHFLGIGGIEDMVAAVKQGIDTFDCVIPTREARHGRLYKFKIRNPKSETNPKFEFLNSKRKFYEVVNVTNAKFRNDNKSLDSNCSCLLCQNHTVAYLHHLFKVQERLAERLATMHNLRFYIDLMKLIREAISNGNL